MTTALGRFQGAAAVAFFVAPLVSLSVSGQASKDAAPAESVRIPLIRPDSQDIAGDTSEKSLFFQLPEHVSFQAGGELRLALYPSSEALSHLCTVGASLNGRTLAGEAADAKAATNGAAIRLRYPLGEGALLPGWNRVSLRFVLNRRAGEPGRDFGSWTLRRADSQVTVVYRRPALFPEPARFPDTFAEEKLLHAEDRPDAAAPTLALLVPASARRDVHLRACAILGARLGQLGYLAAGDVRVAPLENWPEETGKRNGIAVGVRDELKPLSLPRDVADKVAALRPGQGLLAEFILGTAPGQRRWLLASGADDAGLEKALLTLGSGPAMIGAEPNPALIETPPEIAPPLEAAAGPGPGRVTLKELGVPEVRFSGIHTSARSVPGWRLPPGVDLASGELDLRFTHSPNLLAAGSWLEVMLDGQSAGRVELSDRTASGGSARLPLPSGFGGRDPMLLTFRVRLDVASADCSQNAQAEPWLAISGDSALEMAPAPMRVQGLNQFGRLLLQDRFLRRAALLVPADLSLEELGWVTGLAMRLGAQVPSSPVLWPEACGYGRNGPAFPARLQNRSVLLLGSASQWARALPPSAPLPVTAGPPVNGTETARIQGTDVRLSAFEPSLVSLQLLGSPWSANEWLAVAGGWHQFASDTVSRLLTDPAVTTRLHGNVCAYDNTGRLAAYDSRGPSPDSLAERLRSRIPAGLAVEETLRRNAAQQERLRRHGWINTVIFYTCGAVFFTVVGCRLWLMWERAQTLRKTSGREPQPLEGTS